MSSNKAETHKTEKERQENSKGEERNQQEAPMPVCDYAPEWAEHARFYREDEPCDDGRMGGRPCAEDESCPVTDDNPTEDVEDL